MLCNDYGKLSANMNIMTKCHIFVILLAVTLAAGCRNDNSGQSLSEISEASESSKMVKFRQYAIQLDQMEIEDALAAQWARLEISDSAAFQSELELQAHFFSDPNSPMRSEEYLIPVMEKVLESPYATQAQKEDAAYFLPLFSLNRIGTPATDFTFTLKGGRTRTLHSVNAEHIILFFSNPGCEDCKKTTEEFSNNPYLQDLIGKGRLAVVNIYPDNDIDAWYGYVANYPDNWISGYAPCIDEPDSNGIQLYYIRAIPSLYLLDKDRNVVLKDAPLEKIIDGIVRK